METVTSYSILWDTVMPDGFSPEANPFVGDAKAESVNGEWYVSVSRKKPCIRQAVRDAIADHTAGECSVLGFDELTRPDGDDLFFTHSAHDDLLFRVHRSGYGKEWYVMVFESGK